MSWEGAVATTALKALNSLVRSVKRWRDKRERKEFLSAAITELLKLDPDITAAEARLRAAKAVGVEEVGILRAEEMLTAAKSHRRKRPAAKKKAAKKKAAKPKVAKKKSATMKKAATKPTRRRR